MKKRILSIIMAICLALSCVPITVFAANTDATELQNKLDSGGTVTLSKDYTIDTTLSVRNTVTLDLNGHVIKMTGSGSVISIAWSNLTLQDSSPTATHTDASLPAGGVITGGNAAYGGGVYVGSGGSMTMNGGTIKKCSAEYGGGVAAADGSFTMTGGTIANCTATTSNYTYGGGGVYFASSATFTMNGGTIENCSSKSSGGGVFSTSNFSMSGNAIIRGCSAKSGGGVRIDKSSMTMNGGTIEACTSTKGTSDAVTITSNAYLLANGGIVKGTVTFGSYSAINTTSTDSYTKFYNEVTNNGTISGGVYYGGISGSGTVSGTYHTVSFDTNGGSSVPTQWFVNTDKAPALQPADPTRENSIFMGWYNGDTRYDFNQPVTQDITLTAKFSNPKTYNISYDLDGGTATNPATYNVESDAITLNNPVKTGYTFTGWSGTGLTGENNMAVTIAKGSTGDRTYTAHFSQNSYTVKFDTVGGSSISDKTGVTWTDKVLDGITAPTKDGWEFTGWKCGDVTVNADTKYSDLASNDTVASVTLVAQWKDITAPIGEISVGTNKWNTFLNTITFGLFFKDTQSVTITASDYSGEDVTIEYLLSDKELTVDQLNSATFNAYNNAFSINPDNKYVIYAKLTDHAGNVTYISSEGIVLDATIPVITGVENDKTYCEAQTVTVTEEYIESVTVNGTAVTLDANNQFILNPAEGTQTIVVTDKAGNETSVTVTVNDGHTYEWQSENSQYWKKCKFCGDETAKKDIPTITINGADTVCITQDYKFSFTLPEGTTDADSGYKFTNKGGGIKLTAENGMYSGVLESQFYDENEISFKLKAYAKTTDGFVFYAEKTVAIQNEHSGGVASCVELAICEVCGKAYGELDPNNHADLKHISAKAATEDTEGNIEYWYCGGCDKYYSDKDGINEIKKADTVTARIKGNFKSPQTGNASDFDLWISLLFVSGGAAVGITLVGRKKKRAE